MLMGDSLGQGLLKHAERMNRLAWRRLTGPRLLCLLHDLAVLRPAQGTLSIVQCLWPSTRQHFLATLGVNRLWRSRKAVGPTDSGQCWSYSLFASNDLKCIQMISNVFKCKPVPGMRIIQEGRTLPSSLTGQPEHGKPWLQRPFAAPASPHQSPSF